MFNSFVYSQLRLGTGYNLRAVSRITYSQTDFVNQDS